MSRIAAVHTCTSCGTELAAAVLACPGCGRLVHAAELAELKARADRAAAAGDRVAESAAWTEALALLPAGARQHATVAARLAELAELHASQKTPTPDMPKTGPWRWLGGLGTIGALAWKFKFIALAALGKGKFLLLGLTKLGTLLSMLAAFGVYWTAWGVWFALGFVLSIYVHEMGHVAALHRFGLEATAPMFVPGFGAFIRLRGRQLSPYQNARIGLAGPMWGLGAATVSLVVARAGGGPLWAAIAHTGAWLNLFNLMPVWQLDGNRGFAAIPSAGRWIVAAGFAIAWLLTADGFMILLLGAAAIRALDPHAPETPDRGALAQFLFLIVALATVFALARR
ncbi:MAG TPA: site-2 protease family protein [Vicinamibacterales bacterium]